MSPQRKYWSHFKLCSVNVSYSSFQINETQFKKILNYCESGKAEGAVLQTGGERKGDKGYFIKPTVFSDVTDDMKIAREEVQSHGLLSFPSYANLIVRANDDKQQ